MGLAGRAAVVSLLVLGAAATLLGQSATAGTRTRCAWDDFGARNCSAFIGRRAVEPKRTAGWARSRRHMAKVYHGDEGTVHQLSPRLQPRRMSRLRFDSEERELCSARGPQSRASRQGCIAERNLAEALVQPPNPSTEKILREHGIPVIPGVPPIVILRSTRENANLRPIPFRSSH
jgi:hypothetical protein